MINGRPRKKCRMNILVKRKSLLFERWDHEQTRKRVSEEEKKTYFVILCWLNYKKWWLQPVKMWFPALTFLFIRGAERNELPRIIEIASEAPYFSINFRKESEKKIIYGKRGKNVSHRLAMFGESFFGASNFFSHSVLAIFSSFRWVTSTSVTHSHSEHRKVLHST